MMAQWWFRVLLEFPNVFFISCACVNPITNKAIREYSGKITGGLQSVIIITTIKITGIISGVIVSYTVHMSPPCEWIIVASKSVPHTKNKFFCTDQ